MLANKKEQENRLIISVWTVRALSGTPGPGWKPLQKASTGWSEWTRIDLSCHRTGIQGGARRDLRVKSKECARSFHWCLKFEHPDQKRLSKTSVPSHVSRKYTFAKISFINIKKIENNAGQFVHPQKWVAFRDKQMYQIRTLGISCSKNAFGLNRIQWIL